MRPLPRWSRLVASRLAASLLAVAVGASAGYGAPSAAGAERASGAVPEDRGVFGPREGVQEASQRADTTGLTPRVPPDSLSPTDEPIERNEQLEAEVRRVASSLRCPVCLNLSIEDSPSQLARDMKDMIRRRLRRGETPAEIRRYFVDRYGEWVLISPEPEGINLLLWILPAAGLVGGGILVAVVVRRWTDRDEKATARQPE